MQFVSSVVMPKGIFPSPYSSRAVKNAWNSFAQGFGRKVLLILETRSSRAEIRKCLWTISEGGADGRRCEELWGVAFGGFVPFGDCSVAGGGGGRHSGSATRSSPSAPCVSDFEVSPLRREGATSSVRDGL